MQSCVQRDPAQTGPVFTRTQRKWQWRPTSRTVEPIERNGEVFIKDCRGHLAQVRRRRAGRDRWLNYAAVALDFQIPLFKVQWRQSNGSWPSRPDGKLISHRFRVKSPRGRYYEQEFILESAIKAAIANERKLRQKTEQTADRFFFEREIWLRRWGLSKLFHIAAGKRANALYKELEIEFKEIRSPVTGNRVEACREAVALDALKRFKTRSPKLPEIDKAPTIKASDFRRAMYAAINDEKPSENDRLPRIPKNWYVDRSRRLKNGQLKEYPASCRFLGGRRLRFTRRHDTSGGPQLFIHAADADAVCKSLVLERRGEFASLRGGLGKREINKVHGWTGRMIDRWSDKDFLHPIKTPFVKPGRNANRKQTVFSIAEIDELARKKGGKIRDFKGTYPDGCKNFQAAARDLEIAASTLHTYRRSAPYRRDGLKTEVRIRPGSLLLKECAITEEEIKRLFAPPGPNEGRGSRQKTDSKRGRGRPRLERFADHVRNHTGETARQILETWNADHPQEVIPVNGSTLARVRQFRSRLAKQI